ncbi:unnamed protein product [Rodentolepis nana]|uniref:RAD51_interact domain-containing protein n=1 Tax=Rodentolepis nana TaxID=102285 RepID=A0A0R3TL98_RODNA|nr:unnamed protein product [Rodentolepis nana]
MPSPRKSVRKRVNISYAKLMSDESDDEFFNDKFETKPLKRKQTANSDEDEFIDDFPPSSPPKKPKAKKVTNSSTKNQKSTKESPQTVSKSTQLLSKRPIVAVAKIDASPIPNSERFTAQEVSTKSLSSIAPTKSPNPPSTPMAKNSATFYVTPPSGLRIGLSRKNVKKTLHPHIRLTN